MSYSQAGQEVFTLSGVPTPRGVTGTGTASVPGAPREPRTARGTPQDHPTGDVPDDRSPAERKEWWDGLGEEQRQEYLDIAPDLIGNLDGIPSLVRDRANRAYLPVLIDSLEQQSGDHARTMLDGLRSIEEKLGEPTKVPMYLLGIGDEGNGRVIVSYGNPDTSEHVSVHVPEPAAKLDGWFTRETLRRTLATAIAARVHDPSSATIVRLAERGASAYDEFLSGLAATNENEPPHLTAT